MRQSRRRSVFAVATATMVVTLAGCVGNSTASKTSTQPSAQPVAATPSRSAKMICEQEAADEIAAVIGVKTTKPVVPTWSHGLYSCRYVYPNGEIALSVKELPSESATDAYFALLRRQHGEQRTWANLGQGAFVTPNGSMVVRKDYKVLFVDISRLPALFGSPRTARANAAVNVATTIMGCWTGA